MSHRIPPSAGILLADLQLAVARLRQAREARSMAYAGQASDAVAMPLEARELACELEVIGIAELIAAALPGKSLASAHHS